MLKKLSKKELVLYIVSAVIAVTGLTFLILGIIADNISVDSVLAKAQQAFKFRYLGLIIISVAFIFFLIVILVFAKKVDRVIEKETRRKQRLEAMKEGLKDSDTILVENGKIVEKKKAEEEEKTVELKPMDNDKDIPNGNI